MNVEQITNEQKFQELETAWKTLQASGACKDITVTWEWMSTWWDVFKEDRSLVILIVSEGSDIFGIAPLCRRPVTHYGFFHFNRIEFLASGEDEKDEICSDYLDFIILPGHEKAVLAAIFDELLKMQNEQWNELVLSMMKSDSPTIPILFDLAERHDLNATIIDRTPCAYAELPRTLEEYTNQLGRRTRKQVRRDLNVLSKMGHVEYTLAKTTEEIESVKKTLIDLHQSRWTNDGKPGVFSSKKFMRFHDQLIPLAQENGWLRLGMLRLDGKPLACEYNFGFNNKEYAYQAGIVLNEEWNLSIGTMGDIYAIEAAIRDGLSEYDFLAGTTDYKTRLGRNRREVVTVRISTPSAKETLYRRIQKLKKRPESKSTE